MSAKIYPDSEKVIRSRAHSPNFLQYEIMVLTASARSDREGSDEYVHTCSPEPSLLVNNMEVGEDPDKR